MSRSVVIVALLAFVVPVWGQPKHPFSFQELMSLKRVAEPVISPDGNWVLFSAVDVSLEANTKTPHVWAVRTAGGQEREIITAQDADRPRWAPDGKRFLFLSTKEGGSQIWIADFDSSSGSVTGTHKLTSTATEADGPVWSPDGKNILFVSNVYPECKDEACNQKKLQESAQTKIRALIFTHLLYRHWNGYKESKRSHLMVIPAEGGASRDLTPGDHDVPPFSLGGQDNYAFSPDGQEVCYTSNPDEEEATSTNNDLWIVSVNGGPAKNITAENPASDSNPLYSPDGKYIAYRAQKRAGYESDLFRLMIYDRKTGEKKNLTENFDRWIETFIWSMDSLRLYFTADEQGVVPIHSVRIALPFGPMVAGDPKADPRAKVRSILERTPLIFGTNDSLALTPDGKTLLFTRMSLQAPNEIYKVNLYSFPRQEEPLTHINSSILSQVDMSMLEPFGFDGAEGAKVEGFLVKPPNFDANKKYPVKFLIHGGPQGFWGDDWSYRWNPELFAANGYVIVMINPRGSIGYGQKFIDDINGDWGGRVFEDLMKGLDYAERTYPFIDKDRECALGASYGGYMANWILGHTNRFKCIVSHDGMFNTESAWGTTEELWFNEWEFKGTPYNNRELYRKWSPHLSATSFKTPTLVIHSQLDYRLDVSEGFQLFTTLQRLKIPSKMLYFPDEGHWILKPQNSQLWYKTVNDWVDQWIGHSH
jgi:dipeptidyl aminopeptidase/acylaminoacyl peptidase